MRRPYQSFRSVLCVLLLFSAFSIPTVGAAEIEWQSDLDTALRQAAQQERNVFVLVTAPSWCPPCRELDNTTLTSPAVAQWLNRNFIPVRLEDSDPQHVRLNAPAMPSMFVLDPSGGTVAVRSGVPDRGAFLDWAATRSVYLSGRKIALHDGLLRERSEAQWELRQHGGITLLERYDEDERFIYLTDAEDAAAPGERDKRNRYFAVAKQEEAAFKWHAADESWKQLSLRRRR